MGADPYLKIIGLGAYYLYCKGPKQIIVRELPIDLGCLGHLYYLRNMRTLPPRMDRALYKIGHYTLEDRAPPALSYIVALPISTRTPRARYKTRDSQTDIRGWPYYSMGWALL